MTKEQFIEQMTVIEDYLAARHKADNVLNETFFKGSTPSEFYFGDELICLAMERLSELSGIDRDSIEWHAYGHKGRCRHLDGFEMDIQTSADLWDFEQHDPYKQ